MRDFGRVRTTREELDNASLFLRLDSPFSTTGNENGVFRKRSLIWWNLNTNHFETPSFPGSYLFLPRGREDPGKEVDFEKGAFLKRWRHNNHVIFLPGFSSNTIPKWSVVSAFSNSSCVMWKENIWCVFRVQLPFSFEISTASVWTEPL